MTNREKEILQLIKNKPMISQNELAKELNITRSSVAVHITNLLKKGNILGKGYIVAREKEYVSIVGGTNIDIQGFPNSTLISHDSNPGKVKMSLGGVGRNIAENLVRLGVETKLISVVGNDIYGNKILDEARNIGLNMEDSLIMQGQSTSTYLSILNETGDMEVAIAHMDVFDKITEQFIASKKYVIENSKVCVVDTNIPKEVIEYMLTSYKEVDFFLDTVSTTKCQKVKDLICYFHTIKSNKLEAEILTGIKIENDEDLKRAAKYLIDNGVKNVFITLGENGVFYHNSDECGKIKSPKVKVVNSTGAGDAFAAALVYSHLKEFPIEYAGKFAMATSILAISHENTINPNMSIENVNNKMKEFRLC
jgi:pseudouridine kinase